MVKPSDWKNVISSDVVVRVWVWGLVGWYYWWSGRVFWPAWGDDPKRASGGQRLIAEQQADSSSNSQEVVLRFLFFFHFFNPISSGDGPRGRTSQSEVARGEGRRVTLHVTREASWKFCQAHCTHSVVLAAHNFAVFPVRQAWFCFLC